MHQNLRKKRKIKHNLFPKYLTVKVLQINKIKTHKKCKNGWKMSLKSRLKFINVKPVL